RQCHKAVENAVKLYEEEMQRKLKSTETIEDLQRYNEDARVKAEEKYEFEVDFVEDTHLQLYKDGKQKLKEGLRDMFKTYKDKFVNAPKELYDAAEADDVTGVKAALENGANINWVNPNEDGFTSLFIASANGNSTVVSQLLAANADVNKACKNGDTPLSIASHFGNSSVVDMLKKASGHE
ncbi:unnamed protein product, partial [Meganyctiphanes norvegica]